VPTWGHPHVDFIAFTGSKEVGLKIWETAGRTSGQVDLKKVVCEMGGKIASSSTATPT
jgi:acyl-CoA reductase-like NAD-dependent aldehyde dehydrogenase